MCWLIYFYWQNQLYDENEYYLMSGECVIDDNLIDTVRKK